jgi:hypothetical protein
MVTEVKVRSGYYRPQKNESNRFTIMDHQTYQKFQTVYHIPTIINDMLKSPPIRGCKIKGGKPE